ESEVEGRPVQGVKVSAEGKPDLSLFFSRESGLLVKYAYPERHPATGKDALHEVVLSDYRELDPGKADEELLTAAKGAAGGADLLDFLRKRTPRTAVTAQVWELIKLLGDDDFAVREKASAKLTTLGARAVPMLRQAARSPDPEVARRANKCLEAMGDVVAD